MFTTAALNTAANSIVIDTIKVHAADPGASGVSSPVVGEVAISIPTASNGVRTRQQDVPVDAGSSVAWYSLWNGATFVLREPTDVTESFTNAGTAKVTATITFANA